MDNEAMQRRDGTRCARCACGSVEATCEGDPVRVLLCSCTECQRRTGSVYGVSAYFPRSAVAVSGNTTAYTRLGGAGRRLTFHFCPSCGTTLYWYAEMFPALIGVAVGGFADREFPAPSLAVWTCRLGEWVALPDGLPRLTEGAPRPSE